MPPHFNANPANLSQIFDVENILTNIGPQRVSTITATGDKKSAAKCKKEFETLAKKYNKMVNYPNSEGIVPIRRMAEADCDVHIMVGKKCGKHNKLWMEARALAKKWGHSQAFQAGPESTYEYYEQPPSSKWAFW